MGVVVSSPLPTSPFSLVSGIFGFIGFAFTVSTFLKIVWQNLETVAEAPAEVHEYLTTLRQELMEEKRNLRLMRQRGRREQQRQQQQSQRHARQYRGRRSRSGQRGDGYDRGEGAFAEHGLGTFRGLALDDVSLKTSQDMLRRLIKEFKAIERPFLAEGEDGIMGAKRHERQAKEQERERERSPYYEHAAYHNGRRSSSRGHGRGQQPHSGQHSADEEDDDDRFWVQRVRYADLTLGRRYRWIWAKPEARTLLSMLTKLQVRRTSQQTAGIAILLHELGKVSIDIDDRLWHLEDDLDSFRDSRRRGS